MATGPAAAAAARARASAHKHQRQVAQLPHTPAAGSGRGRKRARSQSRTPAAGADAAGVAPAGPALPHVHLRPTGRWEVRLGFSREAGGPRNPNVGTFDSQDEGAVARSLAIAFHQHSQGAPLSAAKPKLLHTLASLQNQKATLRDVHACSGWQDLRDLLQQWQASGKLRRLAASLTFASAADAPPATAAGSARHAQQGGGSKRRALGRQAQEGAERPAPAVSAQRPAAAPSPSRAARQHGGEAVGRRVRVWLRLDDEVEQQHDGRIVECTPTGKHHVVYDDGEEGLVDLATARFRFLPAASRAAPAAELPAEAAAEGRGSASAAGQGEAVAPLEFTSAADAGEELHVWWPKERVWYLGTVTHVLQNGMLCVQYKVDGMELLVDAAENKARQQRHKSLVRQRERQRKAAKEAERAARWAQRQRQQQDDAAARGPEGGRPIKAEPAAEKEEEEPLPPPAPAVPAAPATAAGAAGGAGTSAQAAAAAGAAGGAGTSAQVAAAAAGAGGAGTSAQAAAADAAGDAPADIFEFMMDCADLPEAAAAGFTSELACSFSSLLDMLPPAQQAAKEARLRGQLEQRKFKNAAALARSALDLALAR
ncbi:hypothetical protein COHA_000477 [Chlorella ohadii]|uniref:Uncharacterized protein n=1 Tax=Chlorella ohadii TaxID=2649997 RepID=A0AAD5H6P4_9CHLO|nr:hypothetical protein COHA_000477 [Chlorella ohadii]